jgi:hypothetical protein
VGDDDATWNVLATGGTIGMVQAILCSCKEITLKRIIYINLLTPYYDARRPIRIRMGYL